MNVTLNRLFLGNPGLFYDLIECTPSLMRTSGLMRLDVYSCLGTGKTTVAKLYGEVLAELGLLSKGEVVFKNASDFKGDVLGASEATTRAILKASEGCVLVIDEAYTLCSPSGVGSGASGDPFGAAVIDTIVEQVQGRPGDDRAVILLG